jgi:hypothetical protein
MNRTCDHCFRELPSDGPLLNYCSADCRTLYHRRLTQSLPERRPRVETRQQRPVSPGVAAVLADRAAGSRNTISTSRAWAELANEAAVYQPFFDKYTPSRGNL